MGKTYSERTEDGTGEAWFIEGENRPSGKGSELSLTSVT